MRIPLAPKVKDPETYMIVHQHCWSCSGLLTQKTEIHQAMEKKHRFECDACEVTETTTPCADSHCAGK